MSQWRWVLRVLPRELREQYGADLLRTCRRRIAHERRTRGGARAALYAVRATGDLLATAFRLRRAGSGAGDGVGADRGRRAAARNLLDNVRGDVRFAIRAMVRDRSFTAAAVMTLACGVGITMGVIAVADAALLRPASAFDDPGSLVAVYSYRADRQRYGNLSYPDYLDLVGSDAFSGLVSMHRTAMNLGEGTAARRITGELVDADYFSVLGVSPALGRGFSPADAGLPRVVLSHSLWTSMGGDNDVLGDSVRLNGHAYTIVGVAPPDFRGMRLDGDPQAWVPVGRIGDFLSFFGRPLDGSGAEILETRGYMTFDLVGRRAPGVSPLDAQRRVDAIAADISDRYEGYDLALHVAPHRWGAFRVADRGMVARYASVLAGVSLLVLLIGCINVANLLLARAAARRAELDLRRALGAGAMRVFTQLLVESVVLAAVAGAVGLALFAVASPLLGALRLPAGIDARPHLGGRVVMLGVGLSAMAVLLFGVLPALRASRSSSRHSRRRLRLPAGLSVRGAAVAAQLAAAVALVVAAGLLTRTWIELNGVDPGFDADNVLVASIDPALAGHDADAGLRFYRRLLPRLDALREVRAAAIATEVPLQGGALAGAAAVAGGGPLFLDATGVEPQTGIGQSIVTPRYFEALGVALLAGRSFSADDTPGSRGVVVVNRAFAEQYWPAGAAIGHTIRIAPDAPAAEIVGVVADYRHHALREPPAPHVYWPQLQVYTWLKGSAVRTLLVATHGDPLAALAAVRAEVAALDQQVPLFDVATLAERISEAISIERQSAALLIGLAGAGYLLAGVGLYSSLSYMVSRQRRELGVRAALGASPAGLFCGVVQRGAVVALAGLLGGLGLAALATRAIEGWLYGVARWDPVTLAAMGVSFLVVAIAATFPIARRAAGSDPLQVMRVD